MFEKSVHISVLKLGLVTLFVMNPIAYCVHISTMVICSMVEIVITMTILPAWQVIASYCRIQTFWLNLRKPLLKLWFVGENLGYFTVYPPKDQSLARLFLKEKCPSLSMGEID